MNDCSKRMVVVLPAAQYDEWLDAPPERSMEFMQQCLPERLLAVPEVPPSKNAGLVNR